MMGGRGEGFRIKWHWHGARGVGGAWIDSLSRVEGSGNVVLLATCLARCGVVNGLGRYMLLEGSALLLWIPIARTTCNHNGHPGHTESPERTSRQGRRTAADWHRARPAPLHRSLRTPLPPSPPHPPISLTQQHRNVARHPMQITPPTAYCFGAASPSIFNHDIFMI